MEANSLLEETLSAAYGQPVCLLGVTYIETFIHYVSSSREEPVELAVADEGTAIYGGGGGEPTAVASPAPLSQVKELGGREPLRHNGQGLSDKLSARRAMFLHTNLGNPSGRAF